VAIPLTAESAPAAAALIDGDQMLIAELREAGEDTEVEEGMVAAEGGRKGKRAEYRCAACGYGIVVYAQPPGCPICSETRWEHVEWRPFSQRQPALAAVAG
jgi:rubrerythrin